MNKFKIENGNFIGSFCIDYCNSSCSNVDVSDYFMYQNNITDKEIYDDLINIQSLIKENKKYILDTLSYNIIIHMYLSVHNVHYANELGIIKGKRHEVLSLDRINKLEEYVKSIDLIYEVRNDSLVTSYIKKNFPEIDLTVLISNYEAIYSIKFDGEGGLMFKPFCGLILEQDTIVIYPSLTTTIKK